MEIEFLWSALAVQCVLLVVVAFILVAILRVNRGDKSTIFGDALNLLDDNFEFCCSNPDCKSPMMHHDQVNVYCRDDEDLETGIMYQVEVDDQKVKGFNDDMAGNPSSRRDGIVIWLWCERCDVITALCISQHKGNTLIESMTEQDYLKMCAG